MRAGIGSRYKAWLAKLLILVMGFQEVAWSIPISNTIEFKSDRLFLRKSLMDYAPNGVEILQTFPSDACGTFFQAYHRFDVGEAGLILNNSPGSDPEEISPVLGTLGGMILENPLLKGRQAATRIVQSIEGDVPTRLSGPLEVYGPQAELILANPAGFILDRVSFLNMSKVTLITGKVRFGEDGSLAGVEVQDQGSIEAQFNAAHLERVGQLSLISSWVKLSGEATLPSRTHLKVLSGVGAYDLHKETLQHFQTAGPRVHPSPVDGIDAKAMEGLKVGSARFEVLQTGGSLVAPQTLIASKGALHLEAQGQVQLGNLKANTIFAASHQDQLQLKADDLVHASQDITLFSKKGWVHPEDHHLVAGGDMRLTSDGDLSLEGQVQSQGALEISAQSFTQTRSSVLQAQKDLQISVLGGPVEQAGMITSLGGILSLSAGTFSQGPTAVLQAQGDTTLRADQQAIVRGLVFSHGGTLSLSAAALRQEQGKLYGGKGVLLTLTGSGPLVTLGEVISHGSLKVMATSWTHGVLGSKASPNLPNTVYAKDGIDVQVTEALHLGSKVETGGTLTLSAKQVELQETGSMLGGRGVHLHALEKLTTAGEITSDQGAVKLIAPSWQQTQGKVEGREGVTVQVEELTTWGSISSLAGTLLFKVKSWVHRFLNAPGKASPNTVQGVKGITVEAEKNVELEGNLLSTSGKINLVAPTFRLQEKGELSGNTGVSITASQMAETFGNVTSSAGDVALTAPSWFHRKGVVSGAKGLTLKVNQLTTTQGTLDSGGKILLQTKQWSSQDVPPNTWYTLRGMQGLDLQVEQELKPGVFVESAAGKVTLKAKKMGGASSLFLGHGGVEMTVETPWQHGGNITSKAGKIQLQAPSFHHIFGALSGHQGVDLTLSQGPLGCATLQEVTSEAGAITVKAHTVTQAGTGLTGARGVSLNLTGPANVDRVISREGKVEMTASALKRGIGNTIQGNQGITLNLKQALATQTHFLSQGGTLDLNAPSFQLGGTLQGKDIKIKASQGIDVGSEITSQTLWMEAPEIQVCPEGVVAASDIQARGDRLALQGTTLSNSYDFFFDRMIYVPSGGKCLNLPQDQPNFIAQRLAQGPLLAPREVKDSDKFKLDLTLRGVFYAGIVKTLGSLKVSGSQCIIPKGGVCETGGPLTATFTRGLENAGNLLAQGGLSVQASTFENTGSLGVVGHATFQTDAWSQPETGTVAVSGDLDITGTKLSNWGQMDVGGALRGRFSQDVANYKRISCGSANLSLDGNFFNSSKTPGVGSIFVASKDLAIQGLTRTKAILIHNHASLIESLQGSVFLKASKILNARKVVVGHGQKFMWEKVWQHSMPPELDLLRREVYWGEYSWFWLTRAFYDASRSESEGKILAGQHLVIDADLVENASSLLSSRGDTWINGTLWQHGQKDYTYIAYRWKGGGSRVEYSNYCNLVHDFAPASLLVGGRLRGDVKMKTDAPLPPPLKGAVKTLPYGPQSQIQQNTNISWSANRGFAPQPQTNLQAFAKTKLPQFAEQLLQKAKEQVLSGSASLNPSFNPSSTFTPTVSLAASSQKTLLVSKATQVTPAASLQVQPQIQAQNQPQSQALVSKPQTPNAAQVVIDLVGKKSLRVKKASHLLLRTQGMQVDPEAFVSSDYVIERITYFGGDPERVLRVGDGYVEAQLIQDQILKWTGFSVLRGYSDLNTMIQTLYENGFAYLEDELERRTQHQQPSTSKAQALAHLRTHHIIRGPGKDDPLPERDMLILEPVQLMLPQDEDEAREKLALAITSAREALTSGRPIPKDAHAVLELWAPRFYPSQKTLTQWRGGTVAKQIDLTLGDEPIRGQTFEADQARFQNPHGDFTMVGGGMRIKENLALIFKEGECNLYGTQLEGLGEESKVLLYGGKQLTFEAETLDGHSSLGRTRHLGTSPTLKFQEALVYGGPGGLSIQSALLQVPKQLTLLSQGEIGVGALASELRSYQGGGDNWRKDVRITHRLTQVEVGNLLIATPDNLKLTGLEVTGASAKIQLGGGFLADSPQDLTHHSSHSESDGWFSSSSEDVSYTVQTTRRNVLNVEATTLSARVFLDRGGDYRGHTHVTSPKAQLEAVLDKLERMESSTDSNLFFKSGENRGEIRHTPVLTRTENLTLSTTRARVDILPGGAQPGWLKLEPFDPAALQVPQINASLADFSSRFLLEPGDPAAPARPMLAAVEPELESEPELQLSPQPAQDPELTLHPVQGAYEHWDQSYFGLTPGFAAVVALAVTIATGGTGGPAAQAATAMGFGAEGAVFLAAKAGIQAVAASTVVGTLNHQGNVFKAVEDLGKPDSLRAIAASIVTAGLVEDISHTLKLPDVPKTFGEHFQQAAIKGAVSLPVNTALGGVDPDKALGDAALGIAANTLGGVASQHLGEARLEGLGFGEHKLAHGLVGAAAGAILNPDDPGRGALAGALGQAMAETLAEWQLGVPEMLAKKGSLKPSDVPSDGQIQQAHDLSKLSAAATAWVLGQNVETAIHTADTALEHNSKGVLSELKRASWSTLVQTSPFAKEVDEDLTRTLEKAREQGFSALTSYEKGLFCAFVGGEALCLMSDATMAMVDAHITQGKLGEAEALVAEFAREGATLAEKNTLELGFSGDAAKAAGLFVANVAKNLQHARPAGKTASKKITAEKAAIKQPGLVTKQKELLPNEGKVGKHGELKKEFDKKGDNLSSHHLPHAKYMEQKGIARDDGIAMLVEEPVPGIGGRHRRIHQELKNLDPSLEPRDALAKALKRTGDIYKEDGVYKEIRPSLLEVAKQNKEKFPELFNKGGK